MTILLQNGAFGPLALFLAFAIGHALADFPLQGDYLAREKQRNQASSPQEWFVALTAHSLIQSGAVWLVSGSALIATVELVLHWMIDLGKGEGLYGFSVDQTLHLSCKVLYVILLAQGIVHA